MVAHLFANCRAIFFDAVGTLLIPDPPAFEVYAESARRHGLNITAPEIQVRFRTAFAKEEEHDARQDWQTSESREYERWRQIVATVLDSNDQAIFDDLWKHFAQPSAWRLLPGAADAVSQLARKVTCVGIATNLDRRLHSVLAGFPQLEVLTNRLISSELGWRKPSRRFFAEVVRCAGCLPHEILFVGDERRNDYEGARQAGLNAVLFDPQRQSGSEITTIRMLEDLL